MVGADMFLIVKKFVRQILSSISNVGFVAPGFILLLVGNGTHVAAQAIDVTLFPEKKEQVIDGFGAHQNGQEQNEIWWHELFFDDAGANIYRVDLTPRLIRPYSDFNVYSPWFMGSSVDSKFNLEDSDNPDGPEGNRVRTYTSPEDYSREFGGKKAPIAVMGPDIDENVKYFTYPENGAIQAGKDRDNDFKLIGSIWSPLPWLKISSGNEYNQDWWPGPVKGVPWPFVWGGNYAGGKLDVSGMPLDVFDDSDFGGEGPTSSLTQFARSTAAYIRGFQQHYGVDFYAISIQNELNFEQYYNSMTYPRSSQYIAAIKAIRAEFDRYEDLKNIRLMGPEDLLGGDAYGLWQLRAGEDAIHKNLHYLHELDKDSVALAALDFFCIHGYARDGVNARGSDPIQWRWWSEGWEESPAPGIPGDIKGFTSFDKKSWMTETSGEHHEWLYPKNAYPGNGGWSIAVKIHQAFTAGQQSAWIYWTFTEEDDAGNTSSFALTSRRHGSTSPKYVAFKHFSKHIRPGSHRIDAISGNESEILASTYLHEEDQTLTIVLINTTDSDKEINLNAPDLQFSNEFEVYTSHENNYWKSSSLLFDSGVGKITVPKFGVVTLVNTSVTTPSEPEINRFAWQLSPNPARDRVAVAWTSANYTPERLTLTNSLGQMVMEKSLPVVPPAGRSQVDLDLSGIPGGIYFVNLIGNGAIESKIMVVSK